MLSVVSFDDSQGVTSSNEVPEGVCINTQNWTWYYKDPSYGVYRIGQDARVPKGGEFSGPLFVGDLENKGHQAKLEQHLEELHTGCLRP